MAARLFGAENRDALNPHPPDDAASRHNGSLRIADLSGQWIDRVHARRPPRGIVLDMDSSVSPTHGEQEMSVWNGHYACTCYHPLFVFNQFGDLERCTLRPGNVHSADGWGEVLKPVVARTFSALGAPMSRAWVHESLMSRTWHCQNLSRAAISASTRPSSGGCRINFFNSEAVWNWDVVHYRRNDNQGERLAPIQRTSMISPGLV